MIVFTDESCNTIDDGFFMPVNSTPANWFNLPGSYHNKADTLSFADGHAETHRWVTGNVCVAPSQPNPLASGTIQKGNPMDFNWVVNHSSAAIP